MWVGPDVNGRTTLTGFRKAEFREAPAKAVSTSTAGLSSFLASPNAPAMNGRTGRGRADWMHDYHANLDQGANSNYIPLDAHLAPAAGCHFP